jgi:hypothetical protein
MKMYYMTIFVTAGYASDLLMDSQLRGYRVMPDNSSQKNSTAYRLPALDLDFLLGDSMRGVRLQLEYAKAEERLRAWIVRSTIVVFGSARVLPEGSGDAGVSTATLPPRAVPRPGVQSARWYEEAQRFGQIVSERGERSFRMTVFATM